VSFLVYKKIPYRELKGSPQISFQGEGLVVKRVFETPWEFMPRFATLLLGDARRVLTTEEDAFSTPFYGVERDLPDVYSVFSDLQPKFGRGALVWAQAIESIDGVGLMDQADSLHGGTTSASYELARLTVRYESVTYPIIPDDDNGLHGSAASDGRVVPLESNLQRYVTRVVQPAAEALTLPPQAYKFVTDQNPLLGAALHIVPSSEVHYIWHRVPGRPKAVTQTIGCVNRGLFDGWSDGTLLLLAVEVKPYKWITGRRLCDITYKMKYFSALDPQTDREYSPPRGHNYFLRYFRGGTTNPGYDLATHNGVATLFGGIPVYSRIPFSSLFNPSQAITSNSDDDLLE
jgi:hypothetical protein